MKQKWGAKPLNEVGKVIRGVSFDKNEAYDTTANGLVPILRAGNIDRELDIHNDLVWVPRERVSDEQLMQVGDVAIAMSSGSADIVGKSAQLHETWVGSVGAFCSIVRFEREIDTRFGAYWMRSPAFAAWRSSQHLGANIKNLRKSDLENLILPLPPLDEQRRIVSILDEAEALRQLRARADERMAEFIPALFNQMFGDPATNPKGYSIRLLPEVVFFQEGPGVRNWQFRNKGIKLLNVKNIVDGNLELSNTDRYLEPEEVDTTYSHFLLQAGDMVMATSGVTWGKVAFVQEEHLPLCLNTSTVRFRPLDVSLITPEYMRSFFETSAFRAQIERLITGSAQPNFGPSHLKQVKIICPPIALQREFAARVAEARVLQNQQARSRLRLEEGFQALLHRAFNGEL